MSEVSPARPVWIGAVWLYASVYTLVLVVLNVWTGFHIGMNDFWGASYQAEVIEWRNAESLYDGFFPIGYPALLRLLPGDDFIQIGFAIVSALRIVLLGVFGTIAMRFVRPSIAFIATVVLSLVPRIFEHLLSPLSDMPMLTLSFIGGSLLFLALHQEPPRRSRAMLFLASGVLMGVAGLIRQHGLVLAAGFLLGGLVLRPRDLRLLILAGIGCTLAYLPQFIINMLAHRGPFETFQYVNVYKMMHGVELRDIPLDLPPSTGKIIAREPELFVTAWSHYFSRMLPLLIPAVVAAVFVRDRTMRRLGLYVAIAGVPYLAAVSLGWSTRAVLPLIPWAVLLGACLLDRADRYVTGRIGRASALRGMTAAGILLMALFSCRANARLVGHYLADHHRYSATEHALAADGVIHPKQVFSTDGSLYFPLMPPHVLYFDGTWGIFSSYNHAEHYPRLNVESMAELKRDCLRQGITHLALGGNTRMYSFALDELRLHPRECAEFAYLGDAGGYALFRRRD